MPFVPSALHGPPTLNYVCQKVGSLTTKVREEASRLGPGPRLWAVGVRLPPGRPPTPGHSQTFEGHPAPGALETARAFASACSLATNLKPVRKGSSWQSRGGSRGKVPDMGRP